MSYHNKSRLVLVTLLSALTLAGCISDKAAREFGLAFSAPMHQITGLLATDLIYCSGSFRIKTQRWPTNYVELSEFVRQSDGYLWLGNYERVEFAPLPEDVLQVSYVPSGSTNEMKFRLNPGPKRQ